MSADAHRPSAEEVAVVRLRKLMCVFTGLLVAATWPLWTPGSELPDIPWFQCFCGIPESSFDWMPIGVLTVWLPLEFWGLQFDSLRRWMLRGVFLIPIAYELLIDQHRLQPWVCQMLMVAAVVAIADASTSLRCARVLTISIYGHSALSKCDVAFLDSHGLWLLEGLASSVGLSTEFWSETTQRVLAGMFPVGELLAAGLLWGPRTRRQGLRLAILMHVLLLLTLGPLGHGHHNGVLLWNVYFILMDLLIFHRTTSMQEVPDQTAPGPPSTWTRTGTTKVNGVAAWVITTIFGLLPCLSWWGLWDHWPSWAVYSSRPAMVELYVPEGDIQRLPTSLQPFVGPPQPLSDLCPVNLDAWSFEILWCPMYPQERYRLAVAAALGERDGIDNMRVIVRSTPDRWTGKRREATWDGLPALRSRAEGFRINTQPRR